MYSQYVLVRLTVTEANALAHAAGQMRDDYGAQLDGDTPTDVSNAKARAALRAMEKLDEAIYLAILSKKGGS